MFRNEKTDTDQLFEELEVIAKRIGEYKKPESKMKKTFSMLTREWPTILLVVVVFAHFILVQNKVYHVSTIGDMNREKYDRFISGISTHGGDRAMIVAQTDITYFDDWPLWISNVFFVIYFIYALVFFVRLSQHSRQKRKLAT